MRKIKNLLISLLAVFTLAGCGGGGAYTAYCEQSIETELKENVVFVKLPKKERSGDDYKDKIQVKIRDIEFELISYSHKEDSEKLIATPITTTALNLRSDKTFVNVAYASAIKLDAFENGDSELLRYAILEQEIGKEYHKVDDHLSLGLKFHIELEELDKINGIDLKGCEKFTITLRDKTSSPYTLLADSHPEVTLSLKWDSEASKFDLVVEETPAEEPADSETEGTEDSGDGEGEQSPEPEEGSEE